MSSPTTPPTSPARAPTSPASSTTTAGQSPDIPFAPWSEVGPEFIADWGHPEPEAAEILGQNGSGKTYFECTIMQERVLAWGDAATIICTKPADSTVLKLGWPITDSLRGVRDNDQSVFWPRTSLKGLEREAYHERKLYELLSALWVKDANRLVAFDEIAYAEGLSARMKSIIKQYWREARSQRITVIAMKQRAQGVQRDMHSETVITVAFRLEDFTDRERAAELFGSRRDYLPALDALSREDHDFLMKWRGTVIRSVVDVPLRPALPRKRTAYGDG